jgi:hypothetical protein
LGFNILMEKFLSTLKNDYLNELLNNDIRQNNIFS